MIVDVTVEIPRGSQNKYEVDHRSGRLRLDRVLYSPFFYPMEYGLIEDTLALDGDPLDVLLMVTNPTFPGCVVRGRIIGMLEMMDGGEVDHKLLAVAEDDPRMGHLHDLVDVPSHLLKETAHFFATYKELQGKKTEIGTWRDRAAGEALLKESQERAKSHPPS